MRRAGGWRMIIGKTAVHAQRARGVGYDLEQAYSHHQVLYEMKDLIRISEVCMKEYCCRPAE
jgi:hypothetical protein